MLLACVVALSLLVAVGSVALVSVVRRDRRRFEQMPDVFRCRLRLVGGLVPGVGYAWEGPTGRASWAHDVLVVRLGRLAPTTHVLRVRAPIGSVTMASPVDTTQLGLEPVTLRLRLDEGDVVEVAAPGEARELLAGPFVVAGMVDDGEKTDDRPPGR